MGSSVGGALKLKTNKYFAKAIFGSLNTFTV